MLPDGRHSPLCDSTQLGSQANALEPTLTNTFGQYEQVLGGACRARPAVAEGSDTCRPARLIPIDDRYDGNS